MHMEIIYNIFLYLHNMFYFFKYLKKNDLDYLNNESEIYPDLPLINRVYISNDKRTTSERQANDKRTTSEPR